MFKDAIRGNQQSGTLKVVSLVQTVMFCWAAVQSLTTAISAALGACCGPRCQGRTIGLPVIGPVEGLSIAAFVPALVLVVVWGIFRQSAWAWPLQDAMGVSLILLLLRQFRLPNIKVGPSLRPLH